MKQRQFNLPLKFSYKFQPFVHDFVIFSCLLFAFKTIDHPTCSKSSPPGETVYLKPQGQTYIQRPGVRVVDFTRFTVG
ncbi:MAG: hypothetical protein ACLR6J_00290 [Parabacteroides merdae]